MPKIATLRSLQVTLAAEDGVMTHKVFKLSRGQRVCNANIAKPDLLIHSTILQNKSNKAIPLTSTFT